MRYVDGFVAAVPTANREKFKRHAEEAADVFKENGALKVVECWGDDVPEGQVTSFPMAVKCQPDETVVFSWIVWPSREARDKGMKALMADPRMRPDTNPMPFDGKRMIFGGFVPIVKSEEVVMSVEFNHTIVWSRDSRASAAFLAGMLGPEEMAVSGRNHGKRWERQFHGQGRREQDAALRFFSQRARVREYSPA